MNGISTIRSLAVSFKHPIDPIVDQAMKPERRANVPMLLCIQLLMIYLLLWGEAWITNKIIWSNSIEGVYTDPLWIRHHLFDYKLVFLGFLPFWIMYSIPRWWTTWVIGNLFAIWLFTAQIFQYADQSHRWIAIYSAASLLIFLLVAAWDLKQRAVGKSKHP